MSFYEIAKKYQSQLTRELIDIEAKLKDLPSGTISASLVKNKYYYKVKMPGEKIRMLRKDEEPLAMNLAFKAILTKEKQDLEKEQKALIMYFDHFDGENRFGKFLQRHPGLRILCEKYYLVGGKKRRESLLNNKQYLEKVYESGLGRTLFERQIKRDEKNMPHWSYESVGEKAIKQEERIIPTNCGICVRSKSEAFWANEFYRRRLLFIYEPAVFINGIMYFPDFVIFHPITGQVFFLEHLGLMSDVEYVRKNLKKIYDYASIGLYPNRNLLLSSEGTGKPFDPTIIEPMLDYYFESVTYNYLGI